MISVIVFIKDPHHLEMWSMLIDSSLRPVPDCVQCWMGQTKAVSVISDTRPRPRVIRLQSETYQHIPPVVI